MYRYNIVNNIVKRKIFMSLQQIQEAMNKPCFSISKCSQLTGIHINTLYRIASGKAKKPHPRTLEAIQGFIQRG